jgi:molybdopterin molybdotransferase
MDSTPTANPAGGVEQVVGLVRGNCQPLAAERVPLSDALHRVLREPVCAPEDQPAFDRSAMDGFAVRLDDAGTHFRMVDEIRAGDWKPRQIGSGETVRISTGGALPCAGLQVLRKEDVQVEADGIRVLRRHPTRHVRHRGEDARKGQVLVEAGTRLEPGSLALLASIGHTEPLVACQPRVLHVATGNELVPPSQLPGPGQIHDSNSTLVRAFLNQSGVEPTQLHAPEDLGQAETIIGPHVVSGGAPDVLLVSGGASVGEHDFTGRLFERLGWRIHLAKTHTRPGKPLILATREHRIAFGLPGNPLAHFVCLNLFVRAALERLAGVPDRNPFTPAVLAADLVSDSSSRETLWPAVASYASGRIGIIPLNWTSSGDITSLARANALLRVPPGTGRLAAGSPVMFVLTTLPL